MKWRKTALLRYSLFFVDRDGIWRIAWFENQRALHQSRVKALAAATIIMAYGRAAAASHQRRASASWRGAWHQAA
jgi:hypothetical protein